MVVDIPFTVTVTCPETGIEITAQPNRVYENPDGSIGVIIKCSCCDAYGKHYGTPEYNSNVPQFHVVKLAQE